MSIVDGAESGFCNNIQTGFLLVLRRPEIDYKKSPRDPNCQFDWIEGLLRVVNN